MQRNGIVADKEQWDKLLEKHEDKRNDTKDWRICSVKLVTIKQNGNDRKIKKVQTMLKNYSVIAYSPDQTRAIIRKESG